MGRLRGGNRKLHIESSEEENVNAMDVVANLVDEMLVFACGLMITVMMNWNITSFIKPVEVDEQQKVNADQFAEMTKDSGVSSSYDQKGVVYQDPETGEMYLVEDSGNDGREGDRVDGGSGE